MGYVKIYPKIGGYITPMWTWQGDGAKTASGPDYSKNYTAPNYTGLSTNPTNQPGTPVMVGSTQSVPFPFNLANQASNTSTGAVNEQIISIAKITLPFTNPDIVLVGVHYGIQCPVPAYPFTINFQYLDFLMDSTLLVRFFQNPYVVPVNSPGHGYSYAVPPPSSVLHNFFYPVINGAAASPPQNEQPATSMDAIDFPVANVGYNNVNASTNFFFRMWPMKFAFNTVQATMSITNPLGTVATTNLVTLSAATT